MKSGYLLARLLPLLLVIGCGGGDVTGTGPLGEPEQQLGTSFGDSTARSVRYADGRIAASLVDRVGKEVADLDVTIDGQRQPARALDKADLATATIR
jgi:hypothetical protein